MRYNKQQSLVTIENLQRDYKRMLGLQNITAALSKTVTIKEIAKVIFNEAYNILQAESGDVLLFEDQSFKKFTILVRKGLSQKFIEYMENGAWKGPLMLRDAARTKKPIYIQNSKNIKEKYKAARLHSIESKRCTSDSACSASTVRRFTPQTSNV